MTNKMTFLLKKYAQMYVRKLNFVYLSPENFKNNFLQKLNNYNIKIT